MDTQTQTSSAVAPLEWWQVIELATARALDRMQAAEARRRVERNIATLRAVR